MVKRRFTEEFKREALELASSGRVSIAQVARDLGINESLLYKWRSEAAKRHLPGAVSEVEFEELKRLRKENIRLKQERDFLKKAAAFFAQGQSGSRA